jgi:O-antigen/teichoic acid export membrane protein
MLFDATRRRIRAVSKPQASVLTRLGGKTVRRLGWGVADQAMSSVTNFAVVILVARSLVAPGFGAFSLAYVTYGFALNGSRGLAAYPLQVRYSGANHSAWRRAVGRSTGTAAIMGLITGACVIAVAAVVRGPVGEGFLALGLTLPGLLLQDSWRYAFFVLGRGSRAFVNDSIWALTLVPALMFLHATGTRNVFWFVFAWGASATVAAAVGPLQARVMPKMVGAWKWMSQHRDLGPRYVVSGLTGNGASQVRAYAVTAMLGLAAVGYLQAAGTLMGPFMIIFYGIGLVTVPEAARLLRHSPQRLPLFCLLISAGIGAAALCWGLVLLVALPRGLGHLLLGSIWRPTYPLVLPQTLVVVGTGVSAGAATGLGAMGAAKRNLRANTLTAAAQVVCSLAGAFAAGVAGAVSGTAVAAWIGVVLLWWNLRAAMRESGIVPAGNRLWSHVPGRAAPPVP